MSDTSLIDCEAIRGKFRQWQVEQEPIAAQLGESLAALSAYQSHLDAWQQQLAQERDELRVTREHFDQDRSVADQSRARLAEVAAELTIARDKISALTTSLLSRTEELRSLDGRRAEVVTELELARARERELKAALEELRQTREQERAQWANESRHLRELLERHLDGAEAMYQSETVEQSSITDRVESKSSDRTADSPVFASVMEQFGKLRQQRALERPVLNKTR
jgi:chromosome segregation ATPase